MHSDDEDGKQPDRDPYECPGCGRQNERESEEEPSLEGASFCSACRRWF